MMNVIETAIITIIISFISGLLLEYYKDLAPRILCNIGDAVPLELNNKKIYAYILTVKNISSKTINKITLNVQGAQNTLKIGDAKITKGLKFDSSIENNILDVSIPFLSKNDEFSVTLYVENRYGEYKKPVFTVRSPEKFKEINSIEKNGILSALFNIPRNIDEIFFKKMKNNEKVKSNKNGDFTTVIGKVPNKKNREISYGNRKASKNKKVIAAIVSIILVISIGVFGVFYLKGISTNAQISDTKTNAQNQSNDSKESAGGTNKNAELKQPTGGTNKNASTKIPKNETTKNTDAKAQMGEMSRDTDAKIATDETTGNADTKSSAGETTKNADSKALTGGAAGSTDAKTSTEGTNTDPKVSTDVTTKNTDKKPSTEGTTGNTDTKASTGGTTSNTGN